MYMYTFLALKNNCIFTFSQLVMSSAMQYCHRIHAQYIHPNLVYNVLSPKMNKQNE